MRPVLCLLLGLIATLAAPAAIAADFRLLVIDGLRVKWGAPEPGAGADVSYGFATQRMTFPDAVNCAELAPMRGLAKAWAGDTTRLERLLAGAFAIWSREADLRFRPAGTDESPDILIGAQGRPKRIAFANIWLDAAAAKAGFAPSPARRSASTRACPGALPTARRAPAASTCAACSRTNRPRHRARPPRRDWIADGLLEPGRHRPPDARRHRRGGGALRAAPPLIPGGFPRPARRCMSAALVGVLR